MLAFVYKFLLCPFIGLYIKKVEGKENLPKQGGFVLAFHHESYADGLLATAPLPYRLVKKVYGLAEEGLFRLKGWRMMVSLLLKVSRVIPTNGGVEKVIKCYKKDPEAVVLIAPLLHRKTKPYRVGPGTGVAVIAINSKVPIVPCGISDSESIWPLGYRKPKSLRPARKVVVRYGKPMEFRQFYGKKLGKEVYKKVVQKVVEEIERLSRK